MASEKQSGIQWLKYGKWATPLLMDWIVSEALSKPHLSRLGCNEAFDDFLAIDGEYHVNKATHERVCKFFKTKLNQGGADFLNKYYEFNRLETDKGLAAINELKKLVASSLSNEQLVFKFRKWVATLQPLMHLNAFFIPLEHSVERLIRALVAKSARDDAALFLTSVIQPKRLSYAIREEYELLKIARQIRHNTILTRKILTNGGPQINSMLYLIKQHEPHIAMKILKHKDEYAWLAVTDWMGSIFDLDYFLGRLTKFLFQNPREILKSRINEKVKKELLINKRLKGSGISYKAICIIDILRSLLDLKQEQWDVVSILGYRARGMLTEIGKRFGLAYAELLQLTPIEIENGLLHSLLYSPNYTIGKRLLHRAIIRNGTDAQLLYGSDVLKLPFQIFKENLPKVSTLNGSPCFRGTVKGKVKIISTVRDISKMEQGKILVCPMTNPDYLPAVRKASAIVTDEGGILCHAAIISRELRVPCVVGTKIATKLLKDNDLVEVYADKGIVKIIKEADNVH